VITFRPKAKFDKQAVVVLVESEQLKSEKFSFKQGELRNQLRLLRQSGQFSAQKGQLFPLFQKKQLVLAVGLGAEKDLSPSVLRSTLRRVFLSSFLERCGELELIPHKDNEAVIKAVIESFLIGAYAWKKYKTKKKDDKSVDVKSLTIVAPEKKVYRETDKICEGVNFSRDLVNDNADLINSAYLESVVRKLVQGRRNISLEVLGRKDMQAKGLHLHLAVNQGSRNEPKLIIVKYQGAHSKGDWTAIVGKGITFDTGGLNLKPSGHIETMRSDMSGAAAAIGTLKNILSVNLKRNIIFVCALAENAIGSAAYKPGDVFKSYSGKTVEIGNTDAEGRLVLADALAYVAKNYKPARMIDIATLTGACVVALGYDYSALVSNNDDLAKQIMEASAETDDRVWRLPLHDELKDAVKSNIADLKNVGFPRGAAGTLTASEFLRQFTEDIPWAHLDIAGTAFVEGEGRGYYGHGATGAGIRLLTHFLVKG